MQGKKAKRFTSADLVPGERVMLRWRIWGDVYLSHGGRLHAPLYPFDYLWTDHGANARQPLRGHIKFSWHEVATVVEVAHNLPSHWPAEWRTAQPWVRIALPSGDIAWIEGRKIIRYSESQVKKYSAKYKEACELELKSISE